MNRYLIMILIALALPLSAAPNTKQEQKAKKSARQKQLDRATAVYPVDEKTLEAFKKVLPTLKLSDKPMKQRKVLIYTVSSAPHRFGHPTAKIVVPMLGEVTGAFTAVVSDDLANFEPEALKQFDAVCFYNATGNVFNRPIPGCLFNDLSKEEQQKQKANAKRLVGNLCEYVRDGGGFLGVHAATDCLKGVPAYGEMIGGYFNGHPWIDRQSVMIKIEDPDSSLIQGVFGQSEFKFSDEIYEMKEPYAREKVHVLMSLVVDKSDEPHLPMRRKDGDFPIAWVKKYGKGRVFYSVLGHKIRTMADPQVLQFWLNAFQYVLGDKVVDDSLQ